MDPFGKAPPLSKRTIATIKKTSRKAQPAVKKTASRNLKSQTVRVCDGNRSRQGKRKIQGNKKRKRPVASKSSSEEDSDSPADPLPVNGRKKKRKWKG